MNTTGKHKICFFIGSLEFGGISRVYMNLIPELIQRDDISIDLFLLKEGGEYLKEVPKEARVFVSTGNPIKRLFAYTAYLWKEKPMFSLSTRQRLDIINILCCLLTFLRTKPVITVHTHLSMEIESKSNASKMYPFLSKLMYRIPQKFIAVSQGVKEDFSKRTGVKLEKIQVIYNPIPTYQGAKPVQVHPVFEKLVEEKKQIIISAGRLTEAKDFSTLIHAFGMVRAKTDAVLVILGEGHLRASLEQQIKELNLEESIFLMGYVEIPSFYIQFAKLFVLSSKWEGFAAVIVESLDVGVPVVSTDCPSGPREILKDGEYGKLVPVGDSLQLSQAILSSLQETVDSNFLKQRAVEFSVKKIEPEYYNYLFQV